MNAHPSNHRPHRAAATNANGRGNVDYAMLATLWIVLDEETPVHANGAGAPTKEAPASTRPRRLGRLFHSVRIVRPRASSPIAA